MPDLIRHPVYSWIPAFAGMTIFRYLITGVIHLQIMKLTLHKYIFNEIWPTFLASLFVAVFIIIATKMISITELVITKGVHAAQVAGMVVFLLPDIILFALPAASLIAVVTAFLRLSGDSEIIALKSSGISLYQMLPPVILLSLAGFFLAIMVGVMAVPWGNNSFKELIYKIAESKTDLGIKERVFCEPFDDIVFYVNSFSSRTNMMKDVFVVDRRDKKITTTVIAEKAGFFLYPEQKIITLRFLNGAIFMVEKGRQSDRVIKFNSYDLNIGLKDIMAGLASRRKAPKELYISELIKQLKPDQKAKTRREELRRNEIMIELMEKFSIPIAVFLMGIIGVPLGAQIKARGRTSAIGAALSVFLVYYIGLAGARSICESGALPPEFGVWVPDLLLLILGSYLIKRVANERSINLSFLKDLKIFNRKPIE